MQMLFNLPINKTASPLVIFHVEDVGKIQNSSFFEFHI